MISDYLEISDKYKIASWIELFSLLSENSFSKNDLLIKLGQENSYDEIINNDVFDILEDRIKNYGTDSPLKINDEIISNGNWENNLYYTFYLILDLIDYSTLRESRLHPEKLFELLSLEILKHYINTKDGINLGHPNNSFKENLKKFELESKRIFVETINGNIQNPNLRNKNDNGVDNIIWKSLDTRGNQLLIFNQATIGINYSRG